MIVMPTEIDSSNRKALAFCTNAKGLAYGLYAAEQAARLSGDRDFDIIMCGLESLEIPQYFLDLGIRSVVIDEREAMAAENMAVRRLPLETYMWMWLPKCLSHVYDRILFLDLDVFIVSHELSKLMDIDLGRHGIGSVRDITSWDNLKKPVEEFKVRNIRGRKFLNSGMLLLDTKRFNELKILEKVLEANATGGTMKQADQSLINLALMGEWAELHPAWNWQWTRAYAFYHERVGPQILHFQGLQKPWDQGVKQTKFSRVFVNQYFMFLDRHFPDQAFEALPAAAYRRTIWAVLVDILDHVQKLPRLYLLMRRFKSDFDVLD